MPGERSDVDAVAGVAQRHRAGLVDADVVALDQRARHAAVHVDAVCQRCPRSRCGQGRRAADRRVRPPGRSTPAPRLATALVPLTSVPIRLPATSVPVVAAPVTMTPSALPEMTLRAPPTAPPIVLPEDRRSPARRPRCCRSRRRRSVSVPIRLPWTRLPVAVVDLDAVAVLPEMTLPAPVAVPPIVLSAPPGRSRRRRRRSPARRCRWHSCRSSCPRPGCRSCPRPRSRRRRRCCPR